MTKTIDACLASVRNIVDAVTGVRNAPDGVPDNSGGVFPFSVAWIGPSRVYREEASTIRGLYSIIVQLHFSRRGLLQAEAMAAPFARIIPAALLADVTLVGTCDTFGDITISAFQPMAWGEPATQIQTVGFEFRINDIKIRQT